jgi:membrane-associated phospholipid phosphatase
VRIVDAIQTILYGVLYLTVTCVCGVLAAYALQRMSFPLRDELLNRADLALGFDWLGFAHWVDRHAAVQSILHFAYNTIALQIALPVLVLGLSGRIDALRIYIVAFAIAFILTIVISALMPAAGPIATVDRASFELLRFTGATPIDHLTMLRRAGPLLMTEFPGGIATFPSFHSTVAVLTPLALLGHRRIFIALAVFNLAMLAGTLTEGAHYLVDVMAGVGMAILGLALAQRLVRLEDTLGSRMFLVRSAKNPYDLLNDGPLASR